MSATTFFLSSGWVVGCCCTRSIFLLFGVCECTTSLGDFFVVGIFAFSGLSFLGCSSLSSVILFGLDTGCVVGTSTGICLRTGTQTSTWVVTGASICLASVMVTGSGTSLAATLMAVGSGEDEGDLDEAGGVGRVDDFGEADELVLRGGGGDLCRLLLGDFWCLLLFSGALAGDEGLLCRFLDVFLGLLLLVASLLS